jgi:hypothetical protein
MADLAAKEIKPSPIMFRHVRGAALSPWDSFPISSSTRGSSMSEHRGRLRGTRQRKMSGAEGTYRLTAGLYNRGRALLFAGDHSRTVT